ncbi:MAG: PAS domain S-box protein, partial [Desulfovibrionales bacterium]
KARALKANIDCIENRSEMFTVEFRMQTKSGEWRWILGRGKAVSRDTTGRANRMVGTHTDITERKQTEEALKESEERFFKAFTANPGPMVISEIDSGRFIDVNERWLKMLGHTREETIGHTSLELGIWADPDHRRRSTSVMYSDGHFSDVLTEFITKSGEIRWALWSAVSIVLRGRELMLSLLYDITERKRAEDQLREMQQLLEAAVAQSPSGILIADAPDVSLRIANTAAEAMILGEAGERTSAGALSGSSAQWQTFHPDGSLYPFEQLPLSRAVLHGQTTHNEELVIRDIHGKEHWVSANAAPILNIRGDIVAGIVVFQEITKQKRAEEERQRLEEQFHQAQKLESVGRLAGGVAHDLNNMLVPIIGYGEILLSEALENDPRIEPLEQIVSAGKKARDLVSQLLAFSRKQTLTPRILDLNTLLKDFEKLIRRTIRESIAIHFELEEPLPSVRGDQGQLEQVLMNLAVNAQDAMPEGGELKFETSGVTVKKSDSTTLGGVPPGLYVMLCVTDNGCGMDPDVQDHLFEPFFTTKEQDKGTGLGLATVYGIVKQHGGHVHVSSQPAQGASFRIFLPVSKGTPVQHDQAPTLQAAELAGTETILLVEDNDHVRDLLHAILEKNGYTILVARSGNEALSILEGHRGPVDMLLTDVIMPGMNGEQLHNRMKEIYPKIKTLFVSGHPKDVISESGVIREGINFIQKPFSVSTIETALRKILENGSD